LHKPRLTPALFWLLVRARPPGGHMVAAGAVGTNVAPRVAFILDLTGAGQNYRQP